MDLFKYKATIAQIDESKYIKDLEGLIRSIQHSLPGTYNVLSRLEKDFTDVKLSYKAYIYALNKFADKSAKTLPDFIHASKRNITQEVIKYFETNTTFFSYEELLDVFEHTPIAYRSNYNISTLELWHSVVLDRPIHFEMEYDSFRLTSFDSYSVPNVDTNTNQLIRAIRLKQVLSPNTPSTILDNNLAYWVNKTVATPKQLDTLANAIPLATQQIAAIEEAVTLLSNK